MLPRATGSLRTRNTFQARLRGYLQVSRVLYLVPLMPMCSLVFMYVYARIICDATSLNIIIVAAGGCKRQHSPQQMHASPHSVTKIFPGHAACVKNIELSARGQLKHSSAWKCADSLDNKRSHICIFSGRDMRESSTL